MATFLFTDIDGAQVRYARLSPSGNINFYPIFLHHLVEKHNGECSYCKRPVSRWDASVDHVIPKSRGGNHCPENLALCCRYCNGAKGVKSVSEFTKWIHDKKRMWSL